MSGDDNSSVSVSSLATPQPDVDDAAAANPPRETLSEVCVVGAVIEGSRIIELGSEERQRSSDIRSIGTAMKRARDREGEMPLP